MIDLHMHTKYSDGTYTISEILQEAERIKLECISITDHDTCLAYNELKSKMTREKYSGKIIPGCELKSIVDGTTIEILGYNVNTDKLNKILPNFAPTYEKINTHETEKLCEIFKERGYTLITDHLNFDVRKESGEIAILEEVLSHPENNRFYEEVNYTDEHEFYRLHMSNPNSPYFIDNSSIIPKPEEVIDVIRSVSGLAFIPHVFIYGENSKKVFEKLTQDHLIDGIECYYSKFTDKQINFLLDYCKENKYFVSGGTDYHGKLKKEIAMGTGINNNLNIPACIIEPWAKFI